MIRLAIIEDETLVRQGLMSLFCAVRDFDVVASAASETELAKCVHAQAIDVVLVDVFDAKQTDEDPPQSNSLAGLGALMLQMPHARFVLMDDKASGFRLTQAISYGFSGCVSKYDSFEEIVTVIRAASQRGAGQHNGNLTMSISFIDVKRSSAAGLSTLSPRELEVLRLLVQGLTVNRCAEKLAISPSTVDNHKSSIMKKTGIHKTSDLVRLAVREGLISARHA